MAGTTTDVTTGAEVKTKMKIEKSSKENHIVFTETTFADGLQVAQKRAILQVDTDEYDIDDVLAKAQESAWTLHGLKDANGFYQVKRKEE
jgi:hypothetical protein